MKTLYHPRSLAAKLCHAVIDKGISIDSGLANLPEDLDPRDRAFIQNLSFGVVRWYWQLDQKASTLLDKPIRNKDRLIHFVLLIGIYQIKHLATAEHAAVADTVDCCEHLNKKWAKGLINACLRKVQKDDTPLKESDHFYSHPEWIARIIQSAWPEQTDEILKNNNQAAPLCLRVNSKHTSRDEYLDLLNESEDDNNDTIASKDNYSKVGIRLSKPTAVQQLPNFEEGWASVQDIASQLVLNYLQPESGDRCLDACAAPGGKTALLLENSPSDITMHALDVGGERNTKLIDTLDRIRLVDGVSILEGNASAPNKWWDEKPYDKILLDAPCTGSGVIRRHPDIKHHRTGEDLDALMIIQQDILNALWKLLKPGGRLLYTTCSVFPKENFKQIERFLSQHNDATAVSMEHPTGINCKFGIQTLPGISDMDGFYYCLLEKAGE